MQRTLSQLAMKRTSLHTFLDGYYSTVQGLLDWFEVDLGFTDLLFTQIDLCVMCVFVLYIRVPSFYYEYYKYELM